MKNTKDATENRNLTYTLGEHSDYRWFDYYGFLFNFTSLFTADCTVLRQQENLAGTDWLTEIIEHPTNLREHIYYATLNSNQALDARPVKTNLQGKKLERTPRQNLFFSGIFDTIMKRSKKPQEIRRPKSAQKA